MEQLFSVRFVRGNTVLYIYSLYGVTIFNFFKEHIFIHIFFNSFVRRVNLIRLDRLLRTLSHTAILYAVAGHIVIT